MIGVSLMDLLSGLLLVGFLLGLRHGIDWDHIAALLDITSTQSESLNGFGMGLLYGLGHAMMVAVIGIVALLLGFSLPSWVDQMMEFIIGIMLILLGGYGIWCLHRVTDMRFRLVPRWAMMANAFIRLYDSIASKLKRKTVRHDALLKNGYGNTSSFAIGMIHGIGAETPTQMVLFIAAASAGLTVGIGMLGFFILGLIIANSIVCALFILGYRSASNRQKVYRGIGPRFAPFYHYINVWQSRKRTFL